MMGTMSKEHSRYPYTYACDYMRVYGGDGMQGTNLSRGDASQIRRAIAAAIGMDDHELACKIADYYIENEEKVGQEADRAFKPYMEKLVNGDF
jgi:hypothetical protein